MDPGTRAQKYSYVIDRQELLDDTVGSQILTLVMSETSEAEQPKIIKRVRDRETIILDALSDSLFDQVYDIVKRHAEKLQEKNMHD